MKSLSSAVSLPSQPPGMMVSTAPCQQQQQQHLQQTASVAVVTTTSTPTRITDTGIGQQKPATIYSTNRISQQQHNEQLYYYLQKQNRDQSLNNQDLSYHRHNSIQDRSHRLVPFYDYLSFPPCQSYESFPCKQEMDHSSYQYQQFPLTSATGCCERKLLTQSPYTKRPSEMMNTVSLSNYREDNRRRDILLSSSSSTKHIENHVLDVEEKNTTSTVCTCKKSRCLKLYCQCFAASMTCGYKCKCEFCNNTPFHGKQINAARQIVSQRKRSSSVNNNNYKNKNTKGDVGIVSPQSSATSITGSTNTNTATADQSIIQLPSFVAVKTLTSPVVSRAAYSSSPSSISNRITTQSLNHVGTSSLSNANIPAAAPVTPTSSTISSIVTSDFSTPLSLKNSSPDVKAINTKNTKTSAYQPIVNRAMANTITTAICSPTPNLYHYPKSLSLQYETSIPYLPQYAFTTPSSHTNVELQPSTTVGVQSSMTLNKNKSKNVIAHACHSDKQFKYLHTPPSELKNHQQEPQEQQQLFGVSRQGCKCRRSFCLKKYCECYVKNLQCSSIHCKCTSCQNNGNATKSTRTSTHLPSKPFTSSKTTCDQKVQIDGTTIETLPVLVSVQHLIQEERNDQEATMPSTLPISLDTEDADTSTTNKSGRQNDNIQPNETSTKNQQGFSAFHNHNQLDSTTFRGTDQVSDDDNDTYDSAFLVSSDQKPLNGRCSIINNSLCTGDVQSKKWRGNDYLNRYYDEEKKSEDEIETEGRRLSQHKSYGYYNASEETDCLAIMAAIAMTELLKGDIHSNTKTETGIDDSLDADRIVSKHFTSTCQNDSFNNIRKRIFFGSESGSSTVKQTHSQCDTPSKRQRWIDSIEDRKVISSENIPREKIVCIEANATTMTKQEGIVVSKHTTSTKLPHDLLPKALSFRKICSRCAKTRAEHGTMGFGNKCIFQYCGKCGASALHHDYANQPMGVSCQLTEQDGAKLASIAMYKQKIQNLASRTETLKNPT